jgi:hypothetical protein
MLAKLGARLAGAHAQRGNLELFVHKKTRPLSNLSGPGSLGTL